jgi:hypothetical protein
MILVLPELILMVGFVSISILPECFNIPVSPAGEHSFLLSFGFPTTAPVAAGLRADDLALAGLSATSSIMISPSNPGGKVIKAIYYCL